MSEIVDNRNVVTNSAKTKSDIFIQIEVEQTGLIFRGREWQADFGNEFVWVCQIQGDDGVATVKSLLSLIPFRKRHYQAIDDELRKRGFVERVYHRYPNGVKKEYRRKL